MHGGDDQVPRLGRAQREAHDLGGAHFADDQNIGILAQGIDERLLVTGGVRRHFALPDEGSAIGEDVLEGTFDRDDIARAG